MQNAGLSKVAEQCLLTAAVKNMKKIVICCRVPIAFLLFFLKNKAYLSLKMGFVDNLSPPCAGASLLLRGQNVHKDYLTYHYTEATPFCQQK